MSPSLTLHFNEFVGKDFKRNRQVVNDVEYALSESAIVM